VEGAASCSKLSGVDAKRQPYTAETKFIRTLGANHSYETLFSCTLAILAVCQERRHVSRETYTVDKSTSSPRSSLRHAPKAYAGPAHQGSRKIARSMPPRPAPPPRDETSKRRNVRTRSEPTQQSETWHEHLPTPNLLRLSETSRRTGWPPRVAWKRECGHGSVSLAMPLRVLCNRRNTFRRSSGPPDAVSLGM
jgi:hypothetical protein